MAAALPCCSQSTPQSELFRLIDQTGLLLLNVKASAANYQGREALRITNESDKDGLALLCDMDFEDGNIEADIALKITTRPGVRMPGFVGLAFRVCGDASRYELIYLRPANSTAEDQAMRNHSVQYVSVPEFDWYKLRREWPWVYEAYADLQTEKWIHILIEVRGRSAKLYLNGSNRASLVVEGLRGQDLHGGVGLWPYPGEEAYFSNLRITKVPSVPVKNGSEVAGQWEVKLLTDAGTFDGSLNLRRIDDKVTGTWNGKLGNSRPVRGIWRGGYVELSFDAQWPSDGLGTPGITTASLAGWIDDTVASGCVRISERADGRWSARRVNH